MQVIKTGGWRRIQPVTCAGPPFAGSHKYAAKPGAHSGTGVELRVVADHRDVRCLQSEIRDGEREKIGRRLSKHLGRPPRRVFERCNERADIQSEFTRCIDKGSVRCERDQFSPRRDPAKGVVKAGVVEAIPRVGDDHGGIRSGNESREILLERITHQEVRIEIMCREIAARRDRRG